MGCDYGSLEVIGEWVTDCFKEVSFISSVVFQGVGFCIWSLLVVGVVEWRGLLSRPVFSWCWDDKSIQSVTIIPLLVFVVASSAIVVNPNVERGSPSLKFGVSKVLQCPALIVDRVAGRELALLCKVSQGRVIRKNDSFGSFPRLLGSSCALSSLGVEWCRCSGFLQQDAVFRSVLVSTTLLVLLLLGYCKLQISLGPSLVFRFNWLFLVQDEVLVGSFWFSRLRSQWCYATAALSSDSEIIEGPSRVSLNCPISKTRIKMPVKGNSCKHYQCFDFSNYVEIMSKRPSWRCPSCNQTVCFTDLRVDQKMVKVLQEVGENISEVILSVDGSWTAVSNHKRKEVSPDNTSANQQEGHELDSSSDILEGSNVYDLTGEDDDMEIADRCEPIDVKPVILHNIQGPCAPSNITLPPVSRCTTELNQYSSAQAMHSPSLGAGLNSSSIGFNIRPQAHFGGVSGTSTGNYGMTPVLTDAVTPALNRQTDNLQGTNCPANSMHNNLQLQDVYSQELLNNFLSIPRNVRRDPSAIQALPVPQIPFNPLHHARPTVRFPAASGSSAPFQGSVGSNAHGSSPFGNTVERQRNHLQSNARPLHLSNSSLPNHSASSGMHHMLSQPPHLMHNRHHTLSQPPHLARTSLPRNDLPHGGPPRAGLTNSPSTLQRVQLPPQASLGRQLQSTPLHTQAVRIPSSLPQHSVVTPQAVTRPENLIDFQSEQNWRPSGRMRGALTGEAYSHALSQYMGQATQAAQPAQTPIPRPSVLAASSLPPSLQVQMANRRIASELQDRSATSAATISGTVGAQAETSRGLN